MFKNTLTGAQKKPAKLGLHNRESLLQAVLGSIVFELKNEEK